jgi:hypothetical protein
MKTMKRTMLLILALVAFLQMSCGTPYTMKAPDSFKRFEKSNEFKMITADGVMLKAREVDNYPEASLEFWTDAVSQHLEAQGYIVQSEKCFKTAKGLDGCTVNFLLPHGAQDWVLSETMFVVDDKVVLVETAGPYDRFAVIEEDLGKAILTFNPNQ